MVTNPFISLPPLPPLLEEQIQTVYSTPDPAQSSSSPPSDLNPPSRIIRRIRSSVYRGPWLPAETIRLREIVEASHETIDGVDMVNWALVAGTYGPTRSKHQILCKAVDLGLKGAP